MEVDENKEFMIYINDSLGTGTGVFGVCSTKKDAKEVVRNVGRHELRQLIDKTDDRWNKISLEYDEEDGSSYKIKIQKLGYLYNGTPEVYMTVHYKEVPKVISLPYTESEIK